MLMFCYWAFQLVGNVLAAVSEREEKTRESENRIQKREGEKVDSKEDQELRKMHLTGMLGACGLDGAPLPYPGIEGLLAGVPW